MRGRGVDQPHRQIGRKRHRLARSIVGQAQDGHVRSLETGAAGIGILAQRMIYLDQLDIVAPGQPVADLQAGRAGLAVDEDLMCHVRPLLACAPDITPRRAGGNAGRASPKHVAQS